jgi:protein required for attachment to host cells
MDHGRQRQPGQVLHQRRPQSRSQADQGIDSSESREKTSNLVSDRSGAYGGPGHGAVGQPADPKHHEAERFALELSRELEEGRVNNAYDRLILVASAPFMGIVNNHLPGQVRSKLSESIDKDYTRLPIKDLAGHLESYVFL